MKITWIGQGGFVFEERGCRIAVDPYLSDCLAAKDLPRLFPPPFTPATLAPSLLVCTHDHLDHFDPDTVGPVMDAHPDCVLAGPASVVKHAADMGYGERAHCVRVGEEIEHGPFTLIPTPADHSDPKAIGLLVKAGGQTVYLSADTLYREDLAADIAGLAPEVIDLVLICINGRLGNMDLDEAMRVVDELMPTAAIPMHYGLFAANTADPRHSSMPAMALASFPRTLAPGKPVSLDTILADD